MSETKEPPMTENQWRPIESAPKDGTEVLIGRFDDDGSEWTATAEWWVGAWAFMWAKNIDHPVLIDFEPTHWMPLPEPPEDKV